MDLRGARFGIVGGGISGRAARRLLETLGVTESPTYDRKPGEGDFTDEKAFLDATAPTELVVSPGVPLSTPWIRDFVARGGRVTSELSLAVETLQGEKIVGVTGSLGKSTTVSLLGAAMEAAGFRSFTGGNLGEPLATYAADVLEKKRARAEWIALELSSYQLENAGRLRCEASIVTFLSANHLERYESLEAYYQTKWSLLDRTERLAVLNAHGGDLKSWAAKHPARCETLWASREAPVVAGLDGKLRLVGRHNLDNVALAASVADWLGWPASYREGLLKFPGLAHRLEDVGTLGGIRFVNDTKATSLDSVETAVKASLESSQGRIWCLLGGRDKKLPWSQIASLFGDERLEPVYFGEAREIIAAGVGRPGPSYAKLGEALDSLVAKARSGDWVLLSPGGTSLDEFKNFEARGEFFRAHVKKTFGKEGA